MWREAFVAAALAADQEVARHGLVYDGEEVLAYLRDKLARRPARYPRERRLDARR